MKEELDWIGEHEVELNPNESFAILARKVKCKTIGDIPKGALVIYRHKDSTIRVKASRSDFRERKYSIWLYVDVSPEDIKKTEWKRVK